MNKICKFMLKKPHKTWIYHYTMGKIPKFNKRRAFNKAVGPGKKFKINERRAYVYYGLQSMEFRRKQLWFKWNVNIFTFQARAVPRCLLFYRTLYYTFFPFIQAHIIMRKALAHCNKGQGKWKWYQRFNAMPSGDSLSVGFQSQCIHIRTVRHSLHSWLLWAEIKSAEQFVLPKQPIH